MAGATAQRLGAAFEAGALLACGGLFRSEREDTSQGPPRPHPGGASAGVLLLTPGDTPQGRSGPPTRPGFSLLWGASPPTPPLGRCTRRGFEGSRAFCPGEAALLALPAGHGAHGADSRAAARSVRGRLRLSRSCTGPARSVRGAASPGQNARLPSNPRRGHRTGGEREGRSLPRTERAAALEPAARAPDRRGARGPQPPPDKTRGCPRTRGAGTGPAGSARSAASPGQKPLTLPAGPVPAARVRGQPRVLSGGGCGPHAPRRSGARGADSRGAWPPFSAPERATVMVRPLQN